MKIAVFTETYIPQINGIAVFLSQSLPLLARNSQVVLFVPGKGKMSVKRVNRNFKIISMPSKPFPFYKGYRVANMNFRAVFSALEKGKFDIAHIHVPMALGLQGLVAAKMLGIPTVMTYHTHLPEYFPHLMKGRHIPLLAPFYKLTTKRLIREVYSKADAVTVPTKEFVGILKNYGLKNVVFVPNGIRAGNFSPSKRNGAVRKAYGIPQGSKIILYVGRVSFEKKLDVLLKAFKSLESRGDVFLLLCGDGPSRGNYSRLAKSLRIKNVAFAGFVPDGALPRIYASSDVFVSPSDTETMGITFIEAMASGLPIIGADKAGTKELIKDGHNGLLFKNGSHKSLAEKISLLLKDKKLARRISSRNLTRVRSFSVEEANSKMLVLYKSFLHVKPKKAGMQGFSKDLYIKIGRIHIPKAITWLKRKLNPFSGETLLKRRQRP